MIESAASSVAMISGKPVPIQHNEYIKALIGSEAGNSAPRADQSQNGASGSASAA